jgi:hypothetical protein
LAGGCFLPCGLCVPCNPSRVALITRGFSLALYGSLFLPLLFSLLTTVLCISLYGEGYYPGFSDSSTLLGVQGRSRAMDGYYSWGTVFVQCILPVEYDPLPYSEYLSIQGEDTFHTGL